jgi:hypothetical protein
VRCGNLVAATQIRLTLVTEVAGPLLIEVDGEVLHEDELMHQVLKMVRKNYNREERSRGKYMGQINRR